MTNEQKPKKEEAKKEQESEEKPTPAKAESKPAPESAPTAQPEKPVEAEKPTEAPKPVAETPKPEVPMSESGSRPEVVGKKPTAPAKPQPKPEPTGKFKDLIKDIESLKVTELAELVKELEVRFGVSAAAPAAATTAPTGGEQAAGEAETKANFNIVLTESGSQKINVIKAIREINPDLGLKEAKDMADSPPKEIKKEVPKEEAEAAKKKLEEAGAKVELK